MRFFYLAFLTLLCTCARAQTTVSYQPSTADFPNPERGFYHYTETRSSSYSPLSASFLATYRGTNTVSGANHSIVSSLIFRYFFLEDFKAGAISETYLDQVRADFAAVRTAGLKIIPRFAYTDEVNGNGCSSFICPPYGDAPKSIVLQHIAQLGPILRDNADVIAAVQMGFVGTWGENYYTDYFGDASPEGGQGRLLDNNWQDRFDVLNALLAEVPASRAVQVRYPQMKQRTIYGINAPTSSAALTATEAFTGTNKARIGFHNDCLLASAFDFGTYEDYGNSSGFGGSDSTNLKPYFAADSRFVPVGGETCNDSTYDQTNNCVSVGGIADSEMRRMHYSYLNSGYNFDVNNDWQDGGCMESIKKELGYRFALQSGTYPDQLLPGNAGTFSFSLKNEGYAAPYNERKVEMILRNTATGEVWLAPLPEDPRLWDRETNDHTVSAQLCAPQGMPVGTYDLLLNLPAPEESIYQRPEYSIRLANLLGGTDLWEDATGYNSLGHQVEIMAGGSGNCSGIEFVSLFATLPVEFAGLSARAVTKSIIVDWHTAREENNAYFLVERSTNREEFVSIGRLSPSVNHVYRFEDENVEAGTNYYYYYYYYYRIRQVDLDGSSSLSATVSAKLGESNELMAFPNPGSGVFTLSESGGTLSVYDQSGRKLVAQRSGLRLDLSGYPVGVYLLELRLEGEILRTRVLVR